MHHLLRFVERESRSRGFLEKEDLPETGKKCLVRDVRWDVPLELLLFTVQSPWVSGRLLILYD